MSGSYPKPPALPEVTDYQIGVQDVCFYPEDPDSDTSFWLWYGKSELLGMVDDELSAGLRFRKNNIALGGPERVSELFPGGEGRLNSWFVGEIHVRSNAIVPNARRDGFEHSEAWVQLKDCLSPLISDLCRTCHSASSAENRPTVKVIASAKSTLADAEEALKTGFGSKNECASILIKLQKEEERATKALGSRQDLADSERISSLVSQIQDVRRSLESGNNYTVKNLRSNLSRRERNVLQETLRIMQETLSPNLCSKSSKCYKTLKAAVLAHFGTEEGGRES